MKPENTPLETVLAEGNARDWIENKAIQPVKFEDSELSLYVKDVSKAIVRIEARKNTETDAPEKIEITLDDCFAAIEKVKTEQTPADEMHPEKKSVIGYLHTGNAVDDFVNEVIDELAAVLDQKINETRERNEVVESEPLNITQTKLFVLRQLRRLLYIIEITDDDTLYQEKLAEYKEEAIKAAKKSVAASTSAIQPEAA